jgi:hypothetical protein
MVWKSFPVSKGLASATSVDKSTHLHITMDLDYSLTPSRKLTKLSNTFFSMCTTSKVCLINKCCKWDYKLVVTLLCLETATNNTIIAISWATTSSLLVGILSNSTRNCIGWIEFCPTSQYGSAKKAERGLTPVFHDGHPIAPKTLPATTHSSIHHALVLFLEHLYGTKLPTFFISYSSC